MKYIKLTLFLILSSMTSFGQSLFFDNLNNSTWTSSSAITDSTFKIYEEISLEKRNTSNESTNKDLTIWIFRDSILTIANYSFQEKTESIASEYKYSILEKRILRITLQDGTMLNYKVGILSTSEFAVLFKKK